MKKISRRETKPDLFLPRLKPISKRKRDLTSGILLICLGTGLAGAFISSQHRRCEVDVSTATVTDTRPSSATHGALEKADKGGLSSAPIQRLPMLRSVDADIMTDQDYLLREIYHQKQLATMVPDSEEFAEQLVMYGDTLASARKFPQADNLYRRALVILEKTDKKLSASYPKTLLRISRICYSLGRFDEAEQLRTRAANCNS